MRNVAAPVIPRVLKEAHPQVKAKLIIVTQKSMLGSVIVKILKFCLPCERIDSLQKLKQILQLEHSTKDRLVLLTDQINPFVMQRIRLKFPKISFISFGMPKEESSELFDFSLGEKPDFVGINEVLENFVLEKS